MPEKYCEFSEARYNGAVVLKPFFSSKNSFLGGLYDLLYPHNCIICKTHLSTDNGHDHLCASCRQAITLNRPPFCLKCPRCIASQDDQHHGLPAGQAGLCQECLHSSFDFNQAKSVSIYDNKMQYLIHLFKYGNRTGLKNEFGRMICAFLTAYRVDMSSYDMITAIPLHQTRLRERGYNQSELLTEEISNRFKIKQSCRNLVRVKPTKNQARLKKRERFTNIQGAFKIRNPEEFDGASLLLIDDLFTTGATASEAARVLKEAGAGKVDVLTLAVAQ